MTAPPDAEPTYVDLSIDGGVATITLNRPDRLNAMGNSMDRGFWQALRTAYTTPGVRAVLWRAEGRAFSAGRDVNDLGNRAEGQSDYEYISAGHGHTHELMIPPKLPIVAAVQGWCIGGSWERALLCDVVIAADDAKFRLPELLHGLIPDSGGTAKLFQACGSHVVSDLVLTGRVMDAEEALRLGLVSRVVPRDQLDGVARDVVTAIAAMPPLAVAAWRRNLQELATPAVTDSVHSELLGQMLVYKSDDFAEFRRARAAKRTPDYRGS